MRKRSIVGVGLALVGIALLRIGSSPEPPSDEASAEVPAPRASIAGDTPKRDQVPDDAAATTDEFRPLEEPGDEPEVPESWHFAMSGTVLSTDGPAAGLTVELFVGRELHRVTTTGMDGRFTLPRLSLLADPHLWIDRDGVYATPVEVSGAVDHADVELGTIAVRRGGTITGRVVDSGGVPVAGARIAAYTLGGLEMDPTGGMRRLSVSRSTAMSPWVAEVLGAGTRTSSGPGDTQVGRPVASTDEEGRFELRGGLRHDDRLVIRHHAFLPSQVGPFSFRVDEATDAGDLPLSEGASLLVRVRDHLGRPVAGAEVYAGEPVEVDESSSLPAEIWKEMEALGYAGEVRGLLANRHGTLVYRGFTDEDGALTVRGLPPAETRSVAAVDAESRLVAVVGEVSAGDSAVLQLPAMIAVRVRVVDDADRPIPAATLEVRADEEIVRRVDSVEERATLRLAPGSYDLIASAHGFVPHRSSFSTDTDEPALTLKLAPARALLLQVLDGDRRPAEDVRVKAVPVDDDFDVEGREWWSVARKLESAQISSAGFTTADGRILLDGLQPRRLLISLDHPRFAPTRQIVEPEWVPVTTAPTALTMTLAHGGAIRTRPEDAHPGIGRWTVQLAGPAVGYTARTDNDGQVAWDRLPAGRYTATLLAPPRSRSTSMTRWEAISDGRRGDELESIEVDVTDGQVSWIRFRSFDSAAAPSRVSGRVLINGAAASGMTIRLDANRQPKRRQVIDEHGHFDFGHVASGHGAELSIDQPDPPPTRPVTGLATRSIQLRPGAEVSLEWRISTGRVEGRITDEVTGAPVASAEVDLRLSGEGDRQPDFGWVATLTDQDGRFVIEHALVGPSRVGVDAEDYADHASPTPIHVAAGATTRLDVALSRGATVRGRIELSSEFGEERAGSIRFYDQRFDDDPWSADRRMQSSVRFGEDGSFELRGVVPGDYYADVWIPGDVEALKLSVSVPPAGLDDLVLRPKPNPRSLLPRADIRGRVVVQEGSPDVDYLLFRPAESRSADDDTRVSLTTIDTTFDERLPTGTYMVYPMPYWKSFQPIRVTLSTGGLDTTLTFSPKRDD